MDDQAPDAQERRVPYEPPAILWEHEFIALAACSPECVFPEVCTPSDICFDPGQGG